MQALHTPGVSGQMLPVGMTPKTLRQPKPGEMLLSVHGSPLGVYKENNMEAIQEIEGSEPFCLTSANFSETL
ncbi:Cell division protein borealin [Sesbania bispinosa]|nr:Cell division protein borealin [Sesbania bispinosa]